MIVRDLGVREYKEVWDLQRRLVYERGGGHIPDTVLLVQHPPVYTLGRSSRQPAPDSLPHPLWRVERGGDLTWHGPGQLVGYPILDLRELGLTPRAYIRALEAVLAEAVEALGVECAPLRGLTGLWHGRRKLASIGVAVRGAISYHGFALNLNSDLSAFSAIRPCRLEPETMTSLSRILGRPVDEAAAARAAGEALLRHFGSRKAPAEAPR